MKTYYIASTYGSGNYNEGTYNGAATSTSTGTDGSGGSTGVLANTGFEILVAVTLACLIVFIALIVRFWRRKPTPVAAQAVENTPDSPSLL